MTEEYNIIGSVENWTVDGRIDIREGNKTLEELRQEFYKKWDNDQVTAFPLLQPGESQEQLLEKREIYQRPHAEIYTVTDHPTNRKRGMEHIAFMREAKLAGLQIEATVAVDTTLPWYRRLLRREPRKVDVTFLVIAPPRQAPK